VKVPDLESAVVPRQEIEDYLLSSTHRAGRSKAEFFSRALKLRSLRPRRGEGESFEFAGCEVRVERRDGRVVARAKKGERQIEVSAP